jgi:tetratricopeptide (TPR) repeat protein
LLLRAIALFSLFLSTASAEKRLVVLEVLGPIQSESLVLAADGLRAGILEVAVQASVDVLSREAVASALSGSEFSCSGSCEVSIGRLVRADYLVSGNVTELDGQLFLFLDFYDIAASKLLKSRKFVYPDALSMIQEAPSAGRRVVLTSLGLEVEVEGEDGMDDRMAELREHRDESRRLEAQLAAQKQAAMSEVQSQAQTDWAEVEGFASDLDPHAQQALEEYISRYGEASIDWAGDRVQVPIPELDLARKLLAKVQADASPEVRLAKARKGIAGGDAATVIPLLEALLAEQLPGGLRAEVAMAYGGALFGQADYKRAAGAYQSAIGSLPKGPLVPDALLGQAECFERMGNQAAAQIFYADIKRLYPGTQAAKVAAGRLR